MIAIYCPRASNGAKELAAWLTANGAPAKRVKKLIPADLVVAWGNRIAVPAGTKSLNCKAPIGNKFVELGVLSKGGVPTPKVSAVKVPGWWARLHHHHSANDLLQKLVNGDYYVEPVPTTREFRVHVFKNKAFRTGLKYPNEQQHHAQIRTQLSGWGLTYDKAKLDACGVDRTPVRVAAVAAVKALGYDFGAVDVGWSAKTGPVVFEVNSAPGLEGVTIQRYGEFIKEYLNG